VEEPHLHVLEGCSSLYELANAAIESDVTLTDLALRRAGHDELDYDPIYDGHSEWRILVPIDHPREPARCVVSGTGLTHLGSARNRNSMHESRSEDLTDSMKMFRSGIEGGRPALGSFGISPEWFYKGTGTTVKAHGEPLCVPAYAADGGEEAEIAGLYIIAGNGCPYRVGMAIGNEFSDHQFEKTNYLNLAGSKLRTCALGPELVVDPQFESVHVGVKIERGMGALWSKTFRSGDSEMCHSVQNIEHHHFKFESHRRAGDVHIHFFGTDCLSFSDGIRLQEGDVMEISADGFGRALRNPVSVLPAPATLVRVIPLR
jgi:hypothetical protein